MLALELAMGLFLSLGLFQRSDLRFSEQQALLGALGVGSRPPSWFGNLPRSARLPTGSFAA
jgi:hypothetical protein